MSFFGVFDGVDFNKLSQKETFKLLFENGVIELYDKENLNAISCINFNIDELNIRSEIEINQIIVIDNYHFIASRNLKNEMWLDFYHSLSCGDFFKRNENEVRQDINGLISENEKKNYLNKRMKSMNIFNLETLEVDYDYETDRTYIWAIDSHIQSNFSHQRYIDYLTAMIGGFIHIENDVEKEYANDLEKYIFYEFLVRLFKETDCDYEPTSLEPIEHYDTFESVYILDKLGVFEELIKKGKTREDIYKLIAKTIKQSPATIKTQFLRLEKPGALPSKLKNKADLIDKIIDM